MNDDDVNCGKIYKINNDYGMRYDMDSFYYSENNETVESDEDKVVRLIKGDFEKMHGISYEKFQAIYKYILENHPEKLI